MGYPSKPFNRLRTFLPIVGCALLHPTLQDYCRQIVILRRDEESHFTNHGILQSRWSFRMTPAQFNDMYSASYISHTPCSLQQLFGNLDGVEGGAFSNIIAHNPHIDAIINGFVFTDATHKNFVFACGIRGQGI